VADSATSRLLPLRLREGFQNSSSQSPGEDAPLRAAARAIAKVLRFFAAPSSPRMLFASRVVVYQNANILARLQPRLIEGGDITRRVRDPQVRRFRSPRRYYMLRIRTLS
jgi:hypothetical protein